MTALNAVPNDSVIPAHAQPRFYLGTEPWIPVILEGTVTHVGFEELFRQAHLITGLALPDPLLEHALLRYLIATTYLINFYAEDGALQEAVDSGSALPKTALAAAFERSRKHWWLFHPDTPFLQDPRARAFAAKARGGNVSIEECTDPYQSIVGHVPAKSNESWWYRDEALSTLGLSFAEAAIALVGRHYAAAPGNEAPVLDTRIGRSEGGVMLVSPNPVTLVTNSAPTLAKTLSANLMVNIAESITEESSCYWESKDSPLEHADDALYIYTASGAASYLVEPAHNCERVTRVLRTPMPHDKEIAKLLVTRARLSDPHVMRVPKKDDKPVAELKDTFAITFNSLASQYANVYEFYRRGDSSKMRPCVLRPHDLVIKLSPSQRTLRATTLDLGGNFTGIRIEAVTSFLLKPEPLLLPPDRAAAFRQLVGRLADTENSVRSNVRYRVAAALSEGAALNSLPAGVSSDIVTQLWNKLDDSVGVLYEQITSSPEPPKSLDDETRRLWVEVACSIYRGATQIYETSANMTGRIIRHEQGLRNKLWTILNPS